MFSHKCPGQDRRYWTAADVYEIECPECGYLVEFFKIDLLRRCPECGYKMVNPRFNLGCAKWCDGAELCLGRPAGLLGKTATIRGKIEKRLHNKYKNNPEQLEHIRKITGRTEDLSGGSYNLLLVLLVSLLHEEENKTEAREIMEETDLPLPVIDEVLRLLADLHSGKINNKLLTIIQQAHLLEGANPELNPELEDTE